MKWFVRDQYCERRDVIVRERKWRCLELDGETAGGTKHQGKSSRQIPAHEASPNPPNQLNHQIITPPKYSQHHAIILTPTLQLIPPSLTHKMSRAAKLTLTGTSLFAISTVFFVHYSQKAEKSVRPSLPQSAPLPFTAQANSLPGNARRRSPRHAKPTSKARAPARFRDAKGHGGRIQEATNRTRWRTCRTAMTWHHKFMIRRYTKRQREM